MAKMKMFDKIYSIVKMGTWEELKNVPDFESQEEAIKYAKENNIKIGKKNAILLKKIGNEINLHRI